MDAPYAVTGLEKNDSLLAGSVHRDKRDHGELRPSKLTYDNHYKDILFLFLFGWNILCVLSLALSYGIVALTHTGSNFLVLLSNGTSATDETRIWSPEKMFIGILLIVISASSAALAWIYSISRMASYIVLLSLLALVTIAITASIVLFYFGQLVVGVSLLVLAVFVVIVFYSMRPRIQLAAANLRVACEAVVQMPALLLYAALVVAMQILYLIAWTVAVIGFATNRSQLTRRFLGATYSMSECTTYRYDSSYESPSSFYPPLNSGISDGGSSDLFGYFESSSDTIGSGGSVTDLPVCPDSSKFCYACVCGETVVSSSTCFNPKIYGFSYFILLLSLFWTSAVFSNILHCTTSGAVARWWSQRNHVTPDFSNKPTDADVEGGDKEPASLDGGLEIGRNYKQSARTEGGNAQDIIYISFVRAITTSLGSICFGSLIVAILRTVRALVSYTLRKMRKASSPKSVCNCLQRMLLSILEYLLGSLDRVVQYFNRYSFCFVAVYGYDFIRASQAAIDLFQSRGWTALLNDDIIDLVLNLSHVAIGLLCMCIAFLYAKWVLVGRLTLSILVAMGFTCGYCTSMVTTSVISSAVAAVFVCFAECPQEFQDCHPVEYRWLVDAWSKVDPRFAADFACDPDSLQVGEDGDFDTGFSSDGTRDDPMGRTPFSLSKFTPHLSSAATASSVEGMAGIEKEGGGEGEEGEIVFDGHQDDGLVDDVNGYGVALVDNSGVRARTATITTAAAGLQAVSNYLHAVSGRLFPPQPSTAGMNDSSSPLYAPLASQEYSASLDRINQIDLNTTAVTKENGNEWGSVYDVANGGSGVKNWFYSLGGAFSVGTTTYQQRQQQQRLKQQQQQQLQFQDPIMLSTKDGLLENGQDGQGVHAGRGYIAPEGSWRQHAFTDGFDEFPTNYYSHQAPLNAEYRQQQRQQVQQQQQEQQEYRAKPYAPPLPLHSSVHSYSATSKHSSSSSSGSGGGLHIQSNQSDDEDVTRGNCSDSAGGSSGNPYDYDYSPSKTVRESQYSNSSSAISSSSSNSSSSSDFRSRYYSHIQDPSSPADYRSDGKALHYEQQGKRFESVAGSLYDGSYSQSFRSHLHTSRGAMEDSKGSSNSNSSSNSRYPTRNRNRNSGLLAVSSVVGDSVGAVSQILSDSVHSFWQGQFGGGERDRGDGRHDSYGIGSPRRTSYTPARTTSAATAATAATVAAAARGSGYYAPQWGSFLSTASSPRRNPASHPHAHPTPAHIRSPTQTLFPPFANSYIYPVSSVQGSEEWEENNVGGDTNVRGRGGGNGGFDQEQHRKQRQQEEERQPLGASLVSSPLWASTASSASSVVWSPQGYKSSLNNNNNNNNNNNHANNSSSNANILRVGRSIRTTSASTLLQHPPHGGGVEEDEGADGGVGGDGSGQLSRSVLLNSIGL